MEIIWLIEKNTFDEEAAERLRVVLDQKDISWCSPEYVPFDPVVNESTKKYLFGAKRYLVVPYGAIGFIKSIIGFYRNVHDRDLSYNPCMMWCDFKVLNWAHYSAYWSEFLVSDQFAIIPYGVLKRNLDYYFGLFGKEDNHNSMTMFVRPATNDKVFTGQLLYREKAAHTLEYMGYNVQADIPDNTLTVIAPPKQILGEWRSLIIDGKIISISRYACKGGVSNQMNDDNNPDVRALLEKIAAHKWQPDEAYIADVARVGNEYKLLEIGSPNCAGWYQMDVEKIVDAIQKKAFDYIEYAASMV